MSDAENSDDGAADHNGSQPPPLEPPPPAYGPPPGYWPPGTPQRYKHPQADSSMLIGIGTLAGGVLGFCFCVVFGVVGFGGIAAILTGVRVRRDITKEPHRFSGDAEALTGIVTGTIGVVIGTLSVIFLAFFIISYTTTTTIS